MSTDEQVSYIDTGAAALERAFDKAWHDVADGILIEALTTPAASQGEAGSGTRDGQGGLKRRRYPQHPAGGDNHREGRKIT